MIYTVQVTGGVPKHVTYRSPSWWHVVTTDGSAVAYTAQHDDGSDIYNYPIEGGEDLKLTTDFDQTDEPDYTPDGEWTWFKGARAVSMDLWRMRKGGSDLERMTSDPSDHWFLQPSPDEKSVLYLSYAAGTEGYPCNEHLELRLFLLHDGRILICFPYMVGKAPSGSQMEQKRNAFCFRGCSAIRLSVANSL